MKTYILEVYIEHKLQQLNRPFTYLYQGLASPQRGIRVRVPFHKQSLIGYVTKVIETNDVEAFKAKSPFPISDIEGLWMKPRFYLKSYYYWWTTKQANIFPQKLPCFKRCFNLLCFHQNEG